MNDYHEKQAFVVIKLGFLMSEGREHGRYIKKYFIIVVFLITWEKSFPNWGGTMAGSDRNTDVTLTQLAPVSSQTPPLTSKKSEQIWDNCRVIRKLFIYLVKMSDFIW